MIRSPRPGWWLAAFLLAALAGLYAGTFQTRFLNDDHLFLEEARRRPLVESLGSLGALGNYYRPVSRQLYFEALAPLGEHRPWVFHAANGLLFLAALVLLAELLRTWLSLPGVLAGVLYFATLPLQRVNLTWISCSQDLLALVFSLLAFAAFRRGLDAAAALAYLIALFSKESALPLPLVFAAWARWAPRPESRALGYRLAPSAMAVVIWAALQAWVRGGQPGSWPLHFDLGHFAAGYVHGLQSLIGLDHPAGWLEGMTRHGPAPLPLILLMPIALGLRQPAAPEPGARRRAVVFGLVWLATMLVVVGPAASSWSSYYYTLAGVGAAALVGAACARLGPVGWLLLSGGLLWWHAGATGVRAFAVAERPWVWTSHLTPFYFQRAAALTDTLERQLNTLVPKPEPGTRFFFATLPPWAGFQMGNGASIRSLYRDPSLQSHFYSQFSESTAADRPCRFFYWDGRALAPLYREDQDEFFQVGSDLILLDRLEGARHAFRRGLLAGEMPLDHFYWLGWTELWLLRRSAAEQAWTSYGARDDTLEWHWQMRRARQQLFDIGDTLGARRSLAAAIRNGIGRPEAHAVLGELLRGSHPKYGLLELEVAVYLKPNDWVARRELALGLFEQRLDEQARGELDRLSRDWPDWKSDSLLAQAFASMERRSVSNRKVVEF